MTFLRSQESKIKHHYIKRFRLCKNGKMDKNKVLIITYYWPPAGGPGVQRWLKFVKYLPEFNIEPIIYIPENPKYPLLDTSLNSERSEERRVGKECRSRGPPEHYNENN